ncbi:hypothetical protein AVEN_264243-1 [Araneus ventricosus]|uniref:Uncharacterized protein n=1 Tax=Araneus ventricosus TaxID=182803 RepID=A0A4Y2A439_ARAVE|nr:hypothetical protein AVEN_264243-1 [Araneus ventricosus]
MAQRESQDRRAEETEEQRNNKLSDMAQRGQERKAREMKNKRNRRLAVAVVARRGKPKNRRTKEIANRPLSDMAGNGQEKERARRKQKNEIAGVSAMVQRREHESECVIEGQNQREYRAFFMQLELFLN